jgi:hypothetical protein
MSAYRDSFELGYYHGRAYARTGELLDGLRRRVGQN